MLLGLYHVVNGDGDPLVGVGRRLIEDDVVVAGMAGAGDALNRFCISCRTLYRIGIQSISDGLLISGNRGRDDGTCYLISAVCILGRSAIYKLEFQSSGKSADSYYASSGLQSVACA